MSPNGQLLAAGGTEGLRIWDTATGTLQVSFNGHRGEVTNVAFSADGGTLVSAAHDGTMLVWNVAALLAKPQAKDLTAAELNTLWEQIGALDAATATQAMRQLRAHPKQSISLLAQNLKPAEAPAKETISKLVAELNDDQPKVRARATKELQQLAELAEPSLRACLAAKPTPEQRMRALQLLDHLGEPLTDGDKLRALRAVEVLELIGTAEAAEVLRTMATGAEAAYATREARGALRRIGHR